MVSESACSICQSRAVRDKIDLGEAYRQCGACGFVWRVDRENFPDPNRAYEEKAGEAVLDLLDQDEASGRDAYYREHLSRLHRAAPTRGRLLEIGCGTGGLSKAARDAGWDVMAIEPGAALRREAQKALGARRVMGCGLREAEIKPESFDAIIALDLIEHLPDPFILAQRARKWLRPGGVFLLQTPNARSLRRLQHGARWNMIQPDRHFLFHTAGSLRTLLESEDFEILSLRTVSGSGTGGLARLLISSAYGSLLSALGMGNGLYATAQKKRSAE